MSREASTPAREAAVPGPAGPEPAAVTADGFRRAMRRLPTTVVVVGGMTDDGPAGMVVGTFTSVSIEPLLVGFLGDRKSSTFPVLQDLDTLSFNVLDQDDAAAANDFRKPARERFAALDWSVSAHKTPVLERAVVTVHGRRHGTVPVGDHTFLLAEVLAVEERDPSRRPLVFTDGRMSRLDPTHYVAPHVWQLGWD